MPTHRTFIATYIMANGRNGATYVGMTSNLFARVWKHRNGTFHGCSKTKGCTRLVWFERHAWVTEAIVREKRIKGWKRDWKLTLIETANPDRLDLAADGYPGTRPGPGAPGRGRLTSLRKHKETGDPTRMRPVDTLSRHRHCRCEILRSAVCRAIRDAS